MFDELANPLNWRRAGDSSVVEIPEALGFAYHCLHGALCVQTKQAQLALELAVMPVPVPNHGAAPHKPLYLVDPYMGWAASLGGQANPSWTWIFNAYTRWDWLVKIFGSEDDYRIGLIAYFMLLNFHEFVQAVANRVQLVPRHVPLCFIDADRSLGEKACALLSRNTDFLETTLKQSNVSRSEAVEAFRSWTAECNKWGGKAYFRTNPMTNLLAK